MAVLQDVLPAYPEETMLKKPGLLLPIAAWQFFTAAGVLAVLAGLLLFMFYLAPFIAPLLLGYLFLAVAGGVKLLRARESGRVMGIVHSVISMLIFPVGTVIGALVIMYLARPSVKSYFGT